MNLYRELTPLDRRVHIQSLNLIYAAIAGQGGQILSQIIPPAIQNLADLFENSDVFVFTPQTSVCPATMIVYNTVKSQLLIAVAGMQGLALVPAALGGWGTGVSYNNRAATAPWIGAAATQIMASLRLYTNVADWSNVYLCGHSYGGAVCYQLRRTPQVANASGYAVSYTYGSPKPHVIGESRPNATFFSRRLFAQDDPVPNLPPSSEEIGSLWTMVGPPTARQWSRCDQTEFGVCVKPDGSTNVQMRGAVTSPGVFYLSLASWASGQYAFGADAHTLGFYRDTVGRMAQPLSQSSAPTLSPTRGSPTQPTVSQLSRLQDQELAVVAAQAEGAPQATAVGIQTGVVLVQGTRYRGIRVQGRPWVYYGDTPIIPTRTIRQRRALVRYLNNNL